jgi:hypothetical protein
MQMSILVAIQQLLVLRSDAAADAHLRSKASVATAA